MKARGVFNYVRPEQNSVRNDDKGDSADVVTSINELGEKEAVKGKKKKTGR